MFSNELIALRTRLAEVEKLKKHLLDSISSLEKAQSHFQRTDFGNGKVMSAESVYKVEENSTQRSAIKLAISVMPREFTAKDVLQYLLDFQPEMHAELKQEVLNNVLYKFAKEGLIHHGRKGTRGNPSLFVRGPKPASPENSGPLEASPGVEIRAASAV